MRRTSKTSLGRLVDAIALGLAPRPVDDRCPRSRRGVTALARTVGDGRRPPLLLEVVRRHVPPAADRVSTGGTSVGRAGRHQRPRPLPLGQQGQVEEQLLLMVAADHLQADGEAVEGPHRDRDGRVAR